MQGLCARGYTRRPIEGQLHAYVSSTLDSLQTLLANAGLNLWSLRNCPTWGPSVTAALRLVHTRVSMNGVVIARHKVTILVGHVDITPSRDLITRKDGRNIHNG